MVPQMRVLGQLSQTINQVARKRKTYSCKLRCSTFIIRIKLILLPIKQPREVTMEFLKLFRLGVKRADERLVRLALNDIKEVLNIKTSIRHREKKSA